LHELIDLTVQTVGHLLPSRQRGRTRPARSAPLARLQELSNLDEGGQDGVTRSKQH
jgi:hypothetical protein